MDIKGTWETRGGIFGVKEMFDQDMITARATPFGLTQAAPILTSHPIPIPLHLTTAVPTSIRTASGAVHR